MTLAEYFAKNPRTPKWNYGDRVSTKIGKILVIGMVIREDYAEQSNVLVHLDLPVKLGGVYRYICYVPAKGMKRLMEIK